MAWKGKGKREGKERSEGPESECNKRESTPLIEAYTAKSSGARLSFKSITNVLEVGGRVERSSDTLSGHTKFFSEHQVFFKSSQIYFHTP